MAEITKKKGSSTSPHFSRPLATASLTAQKHKYTMHNILSTESGFADEL
jgi:hypothetical protein